MLAAVPASAEPMPDLAAYGLEGALPETAGRVVLVDFWASWCAPCRASFPVLGELHERFQARGLTVIGVGLDETVGAHNRFVARMKPPFPIVRDADHRLAAALDLPSMPTTLLVDRQGNIRHRHTGFHGSITRDEWLAQIEALLAEPTPDS